VGRNAQKPYSLSALLTWLGDCGMVLAVLVIFVSPLVVPDRTVLQIGAFAILMRNKERAVVMYNVTANTYGRYDVPVTRWKRIIADAPSDALVAGKLRANEQEWRQNRVGVSLVAGILGREVVF